MLLNINGFQMPTSSSLYRWVVKLMRLILLSMPGRHLLLNPCRCHIDTGRVQTQETLPAGALYVTADSEALIYPNLKLPESTFPPRDVLY